MPVTYEIIENVFSIPSDKEMHKELNYISWNGRMPVYDLRAWNDDHTKMGKGCTLTKEELKQLKQKLLKVEV